MKSIDTIVIISFWINILSSVLFCFRDQNPFSARKMFYLFIFSFMGIAPLSQFCNEIATIPGYANMQTKTYIICNLLIFFSIILTEVTYYLIPKHETAKRNRNSTQHKDAMIILPSSSVIQMLIFLLIIFCYFLYDKSFSLSNIIIRPVIWELTYNQGWERVYQNVILLIPTTFFMYILLFYPHKKYIFLFGILFFIMRMPTAISRYNVALSYIPIFFIIFFNLFRKNKNAFQIFFLTILLIVFPVLDYFRHDNFEVIFDRILQSYNLVNFDFLNGQQFDTYQSFCFVVENDIITNGKQLLGVLFFWVPRSLFLTKPEGSGPFIAKEYQLFDWEFANISLNYYGEGYINFGFYGVILFSIIFILLCYYFDNHFWRILNGNLKTTFTPFYFYFIAMIFFILRGALNGAVTVLTGAFIASAFCRFFLRKTINIQISNKDLSKKN